MKLKFLSYVEKLRSTSTVGFKAMLAIEVLAKSALPGSFSPWEQ